MYTLKSIAKRGATLSAAFVLVVSSLAASAAPAFADELNPLTERSLEPGRAASARWLGP